MIHSALDKLKTKIKNQFPLVKEVAYYKGEFEEGSQWNPIFPCVFINAPAINPGLAGSSQWLKAEIVINIYAGLKLEDPEQTTFFEDLILYINNLDEDADLQKEFTFEMKPAALVAYVAGVEAYKIELTAKKVIV